MNLSIDANSRRVRLDPRDPAFYQDPYRAYREIHAAAPAFFWEDYGIWCFARHADVFALLRDRRFGRVAPGEAGDVEASDHLSSFMSVERHSLLELEPPAHTRLRNRINRAFVSRSVRRLGPRIAGIANAAIDSFAGKGHVELIEAFATPIPVIVICELLGVPPEMAPHLLDWSHRMVAMYQFGRTRAVEESADAATREFVEYLGGAIEARRDAGGEDLIASLLEADAEGGALTREEMIAICILLLNAGHEATVHAIGNGTRAILEAGLDPSQAFSTPEATSACVEELLRFDPPLHMFNRYAFEDVEISGVQLRRGEKIGLLLGAANRDPLRFADPDRLDPARSLSGHVAFGAGIHFCVGAPLARLELEIALPILFARLPAIRLAGPPVVRDSFHFHGLAALPVEW